MAAIDKIYVDSYEKYCQFKDWCDKQPPLKDKYGKLGRLSDYLFKYNTPFKGEKPIFRAPYYIDAYVINNCPLYFIQEELMLNYGYWSQERIKRYYEDIKSWSNGECPYWAKLEDFIINDDGTIHLKGLEKSDYELIKEGNLFNSPNTSKEYIIAKHFRCIKHPNIKYNRPFKVKRYRVDVDPPEGFMWYNKTTNTWDFNDEYVIGDCKSSTAFLSTIKAVKRHLLRWKLPVGSKITVSDRYDTYEFIMTK